MRSIIVIALLVTVRADVSHLKLNNERHYLPPELQTQKPLRALHRNHNGATYEYEMSRPRALPVPPRVTVPRSNLHTFVADLPLEQRLFTPAGEDTIHHAQGSDRVLYATAPNSVFHTQINVQSQGSEFNAPNAVPIAGEDEGRHDSHVENFANPSSNGFNDLNRQSKHEHEDIARKIDRLYHSQHRSDQKSEEHYDHHSRKSEEQEPYHEYRKSNDGFNGRGGNDRRADGDSRYHTGKRTFGHNRENDYSERTFDIKDGRTTGDHHRKLNEKTLYDDRIGFAENQKNAGHGSKVSSDNYKIEDQPHYRSNKEAYDEYESNKRHGLSEQRPRTEEYHTHDHSEKNRKVDNQHSFSGDRRTHHDLHETQHRNRHEQNTNNHSRSHTSRLNNDLRHQKQSNYQGLNLINGNIAADQAARLPRPPSNLHGNTQGINIINGNILGKAEKSRQYVEREHQERREQPHQENSYADKGDRLTALDHSATSPSAIKIIAFNNNNLPLPQLQTPIKAKEFNLNGTAPEVIYKSGDEIDFAETKLVDYEHNRQPLESYKFTGKRGPQRKTQRIHDQSNLREDGYHYSKPSITFNS